MLGTESVHYSFGPSDSDSSAGQKTPDFRARAAAKQAWRVRRSEPRRGLLLGIVTGTAIGCLGAFALLSVLPREMPAGRSTTGLATVGSPARDESTQAEFEAKPKSRENSQFSADHVGRAEIRAATQVTTTATKFTAAARMLPRAEPQGLDHRNSGGGTNHLVSPVTPADLPVTGSLTPDPPIFAEGTGTKQRARPVVKKKKNIAERPKSHRLHDWSGHRAATRSHSWAYRGNYWHGSYRGW